MLIDEVTLRLEAGKGGRGVVTEAATHAAQVLRDGGVILYPTDTLYGLGCDALSNEAVAKVYAIKGREAGKPTHAIVADMDMMERYAEVSSAAAALAERFLPGPLTLVLKKRSGINMGIARDIETIGIRIPDDAFCLALARAYGKPITATSANKAGAPTPRRVDEILEQFGTGAQSIDLVVDAGELPLRAPSTVVDLSGGAVRIIREGAITAADIYKISKIFDGR